MPSVPGPHTGILREENLVLREIFGYGVESDTPPLPQACSSLPYSSIKDLLLVAVDVDTGGKYEEISPGQSFHIGVSIFDTRFFANVNSTDPEEAVVSYQFINQDTKPCRKAAKRFLIGETQMYPLPEIASQILTLTQGRDYVLVAHGTNEDVKVLNNMDARIVGNACYILDTVKVAQHIVQLYYRYSLETLLDSLGITTYHYRLHAAGNDAVFALRALLMLTVRDMSAASNSMIYSNQMEAQKMVAAFLEAVALVPYPVPVCVEPEERPVKLSIGAKRRLRQERKALSRMNKVEGSESQVEAGEDAT